jgi:UDP-glucose 4-epimerase
MVLSPNRERPLIWITGAAGFLGAHSAAMYAARGWRVVGIARSPMPKAQSDDGVFTEWIDGGIKSDLLQGLIRKHGVPNAVFHAAGSGTVGVSYENPLRDFSDNVISTANLLDSIRSYSSDVTFVLASSAAVYGRCERGPISEDTPPAPVSPYGCHKRMAEELCEMENRLSGMRTIVIRYFSIYGPNLRKQIIWDIIRRIRSHEPHIELFGTGEEVRDFLFVDDAVELTYLAVTSRIRHAVVNGGSGVPTRIDELAGLIKDVFSSDVRITFNGHERTGDPKFLQACCCKALAMGFRSCASLREGINRYLAEAAIKSYQSV